MNDIDLPIPTTAPKRTGRELHASKHGVMASWHDNGGAQRTHHVAWSQISDKTLMVGGKPITVAQIMSGMVALDAALEQLAEGSGPLVEATP